MALYTHVKYFQRGIAYTSIHNSTTALPHPILYLKVKLHAYVILYIFDTELGFVFYHHDLIFLVTLFPLD